MRKLYLFSAFLFSISAVRANTEPVIEKDMMRQMHDQITRSEYAINWQSNTGIYQSANSRHDLHAVYTGQEMSITPRNTQQQWSFGLAVKGVSADGRSLYKPSTQAVATIHDGTIQFNHDDHYTVEYVNNEQGIRQNFIVQKPAVQAHKLTVQLQASEGWQTYKQSETSLLFKNKRQLLSYNDLKVWDAKGTMLPAHFSVQNNQVQIEVTVEKAVFPVTIDPIVLNGTPQNANTFLQSNQVNGLMGYKVSTAGDINNDGYDDVMLGAIAYGGIQGGPGAVFIFYGSRFGIDPRFPTILKSRVPGGQYGLIFAGGGDVNNDGFDDVITNSPYDSTVGQSGICVYYGTSTGIDTIPEVVYGSLGGQVAIAKDINGDNFDDVLVGKSGTSNGQTREGAVTIIPGGPFGLAYTPWSVIEGNEAELNLGIKVSGAGDLNNDGYNDIVVGGRKKVLAYFGGPSGIEETPASVITLNSTETSPIYSLAADGDLNGDDHSDILIGLTSYTDFQAHNGQVYIHYGNQAGIDPIPATIMEESADSSYYGGAVAFAGDINNDGFSDIIVSAMQQSNNINQPSEGMVYVHYGRANGVNLVPASTIQGNQASAFMGYSVAGAGDVNGDGFSDVLIGAMPYSNGQDHEGAGFVYHGGAASAGLMVAAAPEIEKTVDIPASSVVKVFPNPVVNNMSVQLQGLDVQATTYVQVVNVQGVLVKTIKVGNVDSYQQSIDLSGLTPGIYFVVIQNGSKVFREKVVKQ